MSKFGINEAISVAAKSKLDEDYSLFFDLADGTEFFFNYDESGDQMVVPLVDVGGNKRAVVFYSSKKSAGRHGKYAGIPWEKGLEMIVRMPAADGIVIQNDEEYWIAMTREKITEVLAYKRG